MLERQEAYVRRGRCRNICHFYPPALYIVFALFIITFCSTSANAGDIIGPPRIVDGDTIWISDTKIRLHGIDAPETKQECSRQDGSSYRCGEASADALRILIGSEPTRCEDDTCDRYKRLSSRLLVVLEVPRGRLMFH